MHVCVLAAVRNDVLDTTGSKEKVGEASGVVTRGLLALVSFLFISPIASLAVCLNLSAKRGARSAIEPDLWGGTADRIRV